MKTLRQLFYAILVRPLLLLILGFNVRHIERLKAKGAHLVAANHNSHLDALVLMSLFRFSDIPKIKFVAARDYFCRNKFTTWFSLNIIGIIPIDRKGSEDNPLAPVLEALKENYTVVIFPEGSRGEPEELQPLKFGIAKLIELSPHVTVTPVFMHGLGKSLPRGETLFVPFVCEINVGEELSWTGDKASFMATLGNSFLALAEEIAPKSWQ
jgi:1-acyl-sn-glycerol-3-phosphate acyltransferase